MELAIIKREIAGTGKYFCRVNVREFSVGNLGPESKPAPVSLIAFSAESNIVHQDSVCFMLPLL